MRKKTQHRAVCLDQWFLYPEGNICLFEGVHLLYCHNKLTLRHENKAYLCSSKNLKVQSKIQ